MNNIYDKCPHCGMRLPYHIDDLDGEIKYSVYCRKCKRIITFIKEGKNEPIELKK